MEAKTFTISENKGRNSRVSDINVTAYFFRKTLNQMAKCQHLFRFCGEQCCYIIFCTFLSVEITYNF